VALRHHERQASLADSMPWVYRVGLAVVASATALAFGTPALNPAVVGFSPLNLAAFYAWPLEVAASADWLTRLSASLVVDWVGVFLFGVVHAVYSQRGDVEGEGPPPGLLGASDGYDLLMRWGILLLGAFPNPYVGLALYLLLDMRHKAHVPLMPDCAATLLGNRAPRAMSAWKAREHAVSHLI